MEGQKSRILLHVTVLAPCWGPRCSSVSILPSLSSVTLPLWTCMRPGVQVHMSSIVTRHSIFHQLLTEVAEDYAFPPFEDIPETCCGLLHVFVAYVQVILDMCQIPDKEMLACFYAYCYQVPPLGAPITSANDARPCKP